ncbi:MAG4270 family putative restriction endonuclease [Spiroplasma monobiae]|uniref:Uncharacterized protein n=1 Tax=Spiroplasma monobiae MQ-1 TaxID=1336748 RepID=A0A2K9LUP1_SPISQ|nr:hypothetical protein [Spiroplasma monobiae]AUM62773.1 hypothetical protein SMONO_v1c05240 [Spiroplasma monobiae MQ-1]
MSIKDKTYLVNVPIIRKNFFSTNSAKFKGNLQIISNDFGIIKDWKIEFKEVWIDIFTTPRWFSDKPSLFKYRERLFEELNLIQEHRPSKRSSNLYKLSDNELIIFNNFLNSKEKYGSTLKNIVGVIKGNNPGGEAAKPSSAEMIIDGFEDIGIRNFIILFDDLCLYKLDYFDLYKINAEEITLEKFVNLNDALKGVFEFMQKEKQYTDFLVYLVQMKKYYNKYNGIAKKGEELAKRARKRFSMNVDTYYKKNKISLPFGFDINDNSKYQKCHILEYHIIKDNIIKLLFSDNKANIEDYLDMISDPENFIPLPEEIHRKFDSNIFYYDTNGVAIPLGEEGKYFLNREENLKFNHINKEFLTKRKTWYIEKRKEQIKI